MVNARGNNRSSYRRASSWRGPAPYYPPRPSAVTVAAAWVARRIGWQPAAFVVGVLGAGWLFVEAGVRDAGQWVGPALVVTLAGMAVWAAARRSRLRAVGFATARMAHRFAWRPAAAVAALLLVTRLLYGAGWEAPWEHLMPPAVAALAGLFAWWSLRHVARPHSAKAVIARRAELDQRAGGVASRLDIAEHASPKTLKLKASVLRPTMAGLSRRERRRLSPRQLGVEVARLGWGWWGERIWSSVEDTTLRIGGPRTGKTLSLAPHGIDAPGALITTSTRLDLAEMVHQARSARGRVHIFNPAGLGGLASTITWRVLDGCEDFTTASRRANDMIPESTSGEGERWDVQARRILALFLHAAAVSGRSMRDVTRWLADASPKAQTEVAEALMSVEDNGGEGGRDRAQAARGFWATNDRTRTSITTTMAVPLAWMSDDRARALGDAPLGDPRLLDVHGLIERGETLHLIGHEDNTGLSPLIAALVAEIAHTARHLASHRAGGRLDPPLTMVLDEAALVCPVPLDRWSADMGGRGVTIHIGAQSLSQLRQRWGDDGAGTILANVACFLVFGGSPSADDLRDISVLTGEHRMRVVGADHDTVDQAGDGERRGEYRWVPVMSPAQIRALDRFQVLVLKRGLHTAIGWTPLVTDRKGWRQISLVETVPTDAAVPTDAELDALIASRPRRLAHAAGSAGRRALTWRRTSSPASGSGPLRDADGTGAGA